MEAFHLNYSLLLQLSIGVPLLAGIFLLLCRGIHAHIVKLIACIGFAVPFVIAIILAYQFAMSAGSGADYLFTSDLATGLQEFGISLKLGLNGISAPMFLLAGVVGFAAGLYAIQSGAERLSTYLSLLLIMQGGLMGVFASIDIFFFYFFHEFALIPTFIMVGLWGGQGRRSAAMELTIYLTLGAMLSLIGLIAIYQTADIHSFDLVTLKSYFENNDISAVLGENIIGLLLFGFGILVSLWPFHSWAPKGYAAAPSSAAMLHAGVLKKFGLYGLIQIAIPLLPEAWLAWTPLLVYLALGNIVIIGLVTLAQRDLKMMIGCASVMHMGYAFLGIATFSIIGVGGAVMLMVAHGLSAALSFLLATSVFKRTKTYDMHAIGGLGSKAPVLAGFFVAATMASIGLPGFANFWGELSIFISLWEHHAWAVVPAATGIVISAIYGLRAVARIFFGPPTEAFKQHFNSGEIRDIQVSERVPAIILFLGLLIVGIWPQSIGDKLNTTLQDIYQPAIQKYATPIEEGHTETLPDVDPLPVKQ